MGLTASDGGDPPWARVALQERVGVSAGMLLERVADSALAAARSPFRASRFQLEAGAVSPRDQHDEAEFWFVASGQGVITVADGADRLEVGPGDVVHFAPQVSHTLRNTGDRPMLVFSVWWDAA